MPSRSTNSWLTHFWPSDVYLQASWDHSLLSSLQLGSQWDVVAKTLLETQHRGPPARMLVWDPGARVRGAFMQPRLKFAQTLPRRVKSSDNPTPTPSSFVSCSGKRVKEGTREKQERGQKSNKRWGEKGEGQAVRKANTGCNKRRRKGTRTMESKRTTG